MTTTAWLGTPVEDASEETFLLFSQDVPSNNLGYVDNASASLDIDLCNRSLTVRQSPGLLKSDRPAGTTGAVLWKITPLVAQWLASMPSWMRTAGLLHGEAVVLELGCGISGLIGIVLAPLVSTYILSDQAYVMKTLRANVDANASDQLAARRQPRSSAKSASKKMPGPAGSPSPKLMVLDWETDDAKSALELELPDGRTVDLVVVCDCVYNEHLIAPLVKTLADVCALALASEKPTFVLIAQQLRSADILEQFLDSLMTSFVVWRVPDEHLPGTLQPGSGYAAHLACLKAHA